MKKSELTIGRLAREAGVNIETIRYYQRMGLIVEPTKPENGFRQYSIEIIDRIKFIKRTQKLGFSLQEIAELISLGDGNCNDVREHAEIKRDMIAKQITDLQNLHDTLNALINDCKTNSSNSACPIVTALVKNDNL